MTIEVLIFGGAGMVAKADRITVTVGESPTAGEVGAALLEQHPNLKSVLGVPRLAVNQKLVKPDCPIKSGDEVALISLVGGG